LLADDQPALAVEGHAVRHVRVRAHDRDVPVGERETFDRDGVPPHSREVERVFVGRVDRPLVRVGLDDALEAADDRAVCGRSDAQDVITVPATHLPVTFTPKKGRVRRAAPVSETHAGLM
jgi:hypothetical protein